MAVMKKSIDLSATKPVVRYFNLPAIGRGEVVRLFLEEAGIEFVDDRIELKDWPKLKQQFIEDGTNAAGHVPVVVVNGISLTQHLPILRYFSKLLGKYDGSTPEEQYFVDAVADNYIDWRAAWVAAKFSDDPEKLKAYEATALPEFVKLFERLLSAHNGPFFLGNTFTYVDVAVYQIVHDSGALRKLLPDAPLMDAFVKAVEARPRIAAYLASPRRHELPA